MTNEELDRARAEQAWSEHYKNDPASPTVIAARLAREGWTPPVAVDPDIAEAEKVWDEFNGPASDGETSIDLALAGIKRGRDLAAAEAKPGLVWVKHDFATAQRHPARSQQIVCVEYSSGSFAADFGANIYWPNVTHYAVITPPAEDVA